MYTLFNFKIFTLKFSRKKIIEIDRIEIWLAKQRDTPLEDANINKFFKGVNIVRFGFKPTLKVDYIWIFIFYSYWNT